MQPTMFGSYSRKEAAEMLLGALLEAGVAPEDMSIVVRMEGNSDGAEVEAQGKMMVDTGQTHAPMYGHVARETEGSQVYESRIGGGISTSSPDDDVSSVEEMDESQDASEQMTYPESQTSYSQMEDKDVNRAADLGFYDLSNPGVNSLGLSDTGEDELIAFSDEVSSVVLPGFALVLGDGMLATSLLGAGLANAVGGQPAARLQDYLEDQLVPHDLAFLLAKDFEEGGAVVAIASPPGGLEIDAIQRTMEQQGAHYVQLVEAAD